MNNLHSWLVCQPSTQSWRNNQTSRKTRLQTYSRGEEIFLGWRAFWVTKISRASYKRKKRSCETGEGGSGRGTGGCSRLNGGFCLKYESTVSVFPNRDQHWGGCWKKGLLCTLNTKWSFLTVHFLHALFVAGGYRTVWRSYDSPARKTLQRAFLRHWANIWMDKKTNFTECHVYKLYYWHWLRAEMSNVQFLHFCSGNCFARIKCIFEHHRVQKANHMLINYQAWLSMKSYLRWLPQIKPVVRLNVF